jgi:hypothetical protein
MTINAITFVIATREDETLGLALVAPEARYASVQLAGVARLVRRHAAPAQWIEVERLVAEGLPSRRMDEGVFHELLAAGDPDKRVAYLHARPIDVEPLTTVETLDSYLRAQPVERTLRLVRD